MELKVEKELGDGGLAQSLFETLPGAALPVCGRVVNLQTAVARCSRALWEGEQQPHSARKRRRERGEGGEKKKEEKGERGVSRKEERRD